MAGRAAPPPARVVTGSRRDIARAFAGYALVTAVLAWPWIASARRGFPAGALLVSPSDARLLVWILAWVSHALVTAPARLFDANIAYPAPAQLASAEHMLSSQLLFLPLYQLTGNALLALNVLVLLSYPLAAVAMQRLCLRLGLSAAPAWMAGLLYALGPLRVAGNLHIAQYFNFYLPLIAVAVMRLREQPTAARAVALGIAFLLALFSSYYLAVMACVVAAAWALSELRRPGTGQRRFAALATVALVVPLGALALVSLPYLARPEAGTFTLNAYPGDEMMYTEFAYVPGLVDLLRFIFPSGVWYASPEMLQDPAFWGRVALGILVVFVRGWFGAVPLVLAALGLLALRSASPGARRAARWGVVLTVLATLLMLGPMQVVMGRSISLPFAWILTTPARVFRFPFRFIVVAGFGTALLGAAALEGARRRLGDGVGWALAASAAVLVLATHGRRLTGTGIDEVRGQTAPVYGLVAAETARRRGHCSSCRCRTDRVAASTARPWSAAPGTGCRW
jgi:hypothetical protein